MIAEAVRHMLAAGMSHNAIVQAIADMEASAERPEQRSKGAIRTARWREAKASQNVTERHTVTDVTENVTPPSLDKESFPQTPFKEINPNPVSESARAHTRGSRLPDDWKPTRAADGTKARLALDRRGREWSEQALETFLNHWRAKAGRDACKVDWQATWANWVIEQDRRDGRNGQRINGQSASGFGRTVDALADFVREAEGGHA